MGFLKAFAPLGSVVLLSLVSACEAPPVYHKLLEGERGRVVRIIDGDSLVLDTGQSVRLAEIEAPLPESRYGPAQSYSEEASQILAQLALGRQVQLRYGGLTRDRYDRALAHAVVQTESGGKIWLNHELVLRGAARVRAYPDNTAMLAHLLEAEGKARAAKRGLWALPDYAILRAENWPENTVSGFQIIESEITTIRRQIGDCEIEFVASGLQLKLAGHVSELCNRAFAKPGQALRIRGSIRDNIIEIKLAGHIEIAPDQPKNG